MVSLLLGDCLESMKKLEANSVDSVVTDPPYGLSFMGKKWDYEVPSVEIWREVFRVLKPGGHVLSFCGTRTYHRMVVNIEDAGFEIRDQLQWIYGSGFPKSLNIRKEAAKKGHACGCEAIPEYNMRQMPSADLSTKVTDSKAARKILQSSMSKQNLSKQSAEASTVASGREESCMEGRRDLQANKGKLHRAEVCSVSGAAASDVSQRRLRNGASSSYGDSSGPTTRTGRGGTSPRSQHEKQSSDESGNVAEQFESQTSRAWPRCSRCEKPILPEGFGTALKPANEPICLARKPLIGTVAKNVLEFGTGGLNIDASRISAVGYSSGGQNKSIAFGMNGLTDKQPRCDGSSGRFPSNVLLDEMAAEMLDEQTEMEVSRFFYVAKTSKRERGEGNIHPTVKPLKLMSYLIKLITPSGGVVLDPFMGSGTTGCAAVKDGFDFIGCEMSEEYLKIGEARIYRAQHKPEGSSTSDVAHAGEVRDVNDRA